MPDKKRVRPITEVEPELLRKTTDRFTALIAERLPFMSSVEELEQRYGSHMAASDRSEPQQTAEPGEAEVVNLQAKRSRSR
jgi:hypothetical protein